MKKLLIPVFLISLLAFGACERKAEVRDNQLLARWEGLYGLPAFGKVAASDFAPAFDEALKQHGEEIERIKASGEAPGFENVIAALDDSGTLLERVFSVYSLMAAVDSSSVLREMEEDIAVRLATHRDMVFHDERLFDKVEQVYIMRESSGLDPMQIRLTERTYEAFVRGGALLDERDKDALRTINAGLAKREAAFGRHIAWASKESYILMDSTEITGLSYPVRDSTKKMAVAAGADSLFLFLLDEPLVAPELTVSTVETFRERLYAAYRNRCEEDDANDNRPLVAEIAGLRHEKARLLGFDGYSDYAARGGMLNGRAAVYSMLDGIWGPALDKAAGEEESRRQLPGVDSTRVRPWDLPYDNDRLLKRETGMDGTQMEVFFSIDNVRVGVFELANRLWGLTFRPVQLDLYSVDCEAFEVFDIDGSLMGLFVLDSYSRMDKKPGTGIYPLSYEAPEGETDPVPAVFVVLNFTRPQNLSRPTLLSTQGVDDFFRMVGNAVGRLFVETPYRGLREADRDIQGLPGELMCRWAFQGQMLGRYALHYSSGKLPIESDIRHIAAVPAMFSGGRTAALAAAAYMDMDIHSSGYDFTNQDTFELEHLREKRGMPQFIDPEYRLPAFGEVFGQDAGAGYYTRLWSEVLASDIFGRFAPGNIFDRRIAGQLREKVLSKGGSVAAAEMYRDFMGRDASLEAFLIEKGFADPPAQPERPVRESTEYPDGGTAVGQGAGENTGIGSETGVAGSIPVINGKKNRYEKDS